MILKHDPINQSRIRLRGMRWSWSRKSRVIRSAHAPLPATSPGGSSAARHRETFGIRRGANSKSSAQPGLVLAGLRRQFRGSLGCVATSHTGRVVRRPILCAACRCRCMVLAANVSHSIPGIVPAQSLSRLGSSSDKTHGGMPSSADVQGYAVWVGLGRPGGN